MKCIKCENETRVVTTVAKSRVLVIRYRICPLGHKATTEERYLTDEECSKQASESAKQVWVKRKLKGLK